jgi:hypothetical protein
MSLGNKLVIIIISSIILFFGYLEYSSLGIEYDEIYDRDDWRHIEIRGKMVVAPTIVDYEILSPYMIGIRLPSKEHECKNESLIMIDNIKMYFILNLLTGDNLNFSSESDFKRKLKELGLMKGYENLKYSKFHSVWEHYSEYYKTFSVYSSCN